MLELTRFACRFTDIWVGKPCIEEDFVTRDVTPQECRLRDLTYSAPIYVNLRYTQVASNELKPKNNVMIGRLPIMLRSKHCILHGASEEQLAQYRECPLDPGGYFIVRGTEKVILIQEQLSKNRIILEVDNKGLYSANVTSSNYERKSKTTVIYKNGELLLKHNTFGEDLPIMVVLKGMGVETDQEAVQLVGSESYYIDHLAPSLQKCAALGVNTQLQALDYIGGKIKAGTRRRRKTKVDEARDILAQIILNHVPCKNYDFRLKAIYLGMMLRKLLHSVNDQSALSDKDYYGNKRLELAGQLLSLLFEDLFKRFTKDISRRADDALGKQNRAQPFDVVRYITPDQIYFGFVSALSSGNWRIKRFKMDRAGITQGRLFPN